jgi:hypothetical protein
VVGDFLQAEGSTFEVDIPIKKTIEPGKTQIWYCRVFAQRQKDPVTGEPIIMVSHQDVTNLRKVRMFVVDCCCMLPLCEGACGRSLPCSKATPHGGMANCEMLPLFLIHFARELTLRIDDVCAG